MTNGRHRARWMAEIISELQRYASKTREAPETGHVRKALANLDDARRSALESQYDSDEQHPEE